MKTEQARVYKSTTHPSARCRRMIGLIALLCCLLFFASHPTLAVALVLAFFQSPLAPRHWLAGALPVATACVALTLHMHALPIADTRTYFAAQHNRSGWCRPQHVRVVESVARMHETACTLDDFAPVHVPRPCWTLFRGAHVRRRQFGLQKFFRKVRIKYPFFRAKQIPAWKNWNWSMARRRMARRRVCGSAGPASWAPRRVAKGWPARGQTHSVTAAGEHQQQGDEVGQCFFG